MRQGERNQERGNEKDKTVTIAGDSLGKKRGGYRSDIYFESKKGRDKSRF